MSGIIGVDPGLSGGIALIRLDRVYAEKMPATERDMWDLLKLYASMASHAWLEKVHSHPGQGVASTWKFGQNYGALRMALTGLGIPFSEVAPGTWQRSMGCLSKGDKNVTKRRAQELFGGQVPKITHALADALLIAEYGREKAEAS